MMMIIYFVTLLQHHNCSQIRRGRGVYNDGRIVDFFFIASHDMTCMVVVTPSHVATTIKRTCRSHEECAFHSIWPSPF